MTIESLIQDIRYAIRSLRRAPLFTASVAGTIGLGLGILCSAFTIVNAYLLKPIDLPNPRELYALSWATATASPRQFTVGDVIALADSPSPLSGVAAGTGAFATYNARPLPGEVVTGNYFAVIGAGMLLGRPLLPEDTPAPGARAVVVLSYEAWRKHFASDPQIVGREITLSGRPFTVVGVTKSGQLLPGYDNLGFWAPLTMASAFHAADPWQGAEATLSVVGRVRAGGTQAQLRAWFDTWLRQRFPSGSEGAPRRIGVASLATRIPQNRGTIILFSVLVSGFALVLLVACANVMNMMLARGLSRQRELGVRLSLGATRARVVRQLVIESLVLALPAAAIGLGFTLLTARVFPALLVGTLPQGTHVSSLYIAPLDPDVRVLALLAIASIAGAILVGLSPALQVARANLVLVTRGELGPETRISGVRTALVGAQIAAATLCLVGATGLAGEAARMASGETGLDFARVINVRVAHDHRAAIAERLDAHPAIERVAVSSHAPLNGEARTIRFVPSRSGPPTEEKAIYMVVSPEYFPLLGIDLTQGRLFTELEATAKTDVVVVSRSTARRFWPGADPIGQTLEIRQAVELSSPQPAQTRVHVIGVVEDVVQGSLLEGMPAACVYFPVAIGAAQPLSLLVRGRGDVAATIDAIRAAIEDAHPNEAFETRPVRDLAALQLWAVGSFSTAAAIPGIVGVLLAFTGTYGVVAFVAAQRRREFGVRMALGATATRIVRGMVGESLRTGLIGAGAGALIAVGASRAASSALEFIPTFGPGPYVTAGAMVLAASVIAAWLPSARAARIDPAAALRAE
jgi:predicted permease